MKPNLPVLFCFLTLGVSSFANKNVNEKDYANRVWGPHIVQPAKISNPEQISQELLAIFKKAFPDAQEVKWKESPDKYTVNFKTGSIIAIVEYDKEEQFISSTRYYTESNLPPNILAKLRKKYPEKKIIGIIEKTVAVSERNTEPELDYYIKLEDATSCITVRSGSDDNMVITEKYKKPSE